MALQSRQQLGRRLNRGRIVTQNYIVSPMRKVLQEQKSITQQRLKLRDELVTSLKHSEGIVTVSSLSLVKSLELLYRYDRVASSTNVMALLQGFFSQLNVSYPGVMYGSPTTLSHLCSFLTSFKDVPVKVLSSTLSFSAPQNPQHYSRRDYIELIETGARGYIVQPGQFQLQDNSQLTLKSRGFYMVPATANPADLKAWQTPLLDAKIGLDDAGNAGLVLNTKHEFSIASADSEVIVLSNEAGQLQILDRLNKPSC